MEPKVVEKFVTTDQYADTKNNKLKVSLLMDQMFPQMKAVLSAKRLGKNVEKDSCREWKMRGICQRTR